MKYNLSPLEIIKLLGYDNPAGREWLENLKRENQIPLPKVYCDFMEYAAGCPLFATSDLWAGRLSQLPKGQWAEDYLLIGSDYVHDTGFYGFRKTDLSQDDPPIYWRRGGDSCPEWRLEYKRLSDFLRRVLADILSCNDFDTAKDALKKMGWQYEEDINIPKGSRTGSKAFLRKQGISFLRLKKYDSPNGIKVYCCYDEKKNVFYTGIVDEGEVLLSAIRRGEGFGFSK